MTSHSDDGQLRRLMIYRSKYQLKKHFVEVQGAVIASYYEASHSMPFFSRAEFTKLRKKGRAEKGKPEDDNTVHIENAIMEKLEKGEGGTLHQIKWRRVSSLPSAGLIKSEIWS